MLCDRDTLPSTDAHAIETATSRRLRVLSRYHLENYFLDENTIAKVFEPMTPEDAWQRAPERIRSKLKDIAREQASYAAALATAANFREQVGNLDVMPSGPNGKTAVELGDMIWSIADEEVNRITNIVTRDKIDGFVADVMQKIELSLAGDSVAWKAIIPGKIIIRKFCGVAGLDYEFFRSAYINVADSMAVNPFAELISIFDEFDRFGT